MGLICGLCRGEWRSFCLMLPCESGLQIETTAFWTPFKPRNPVTRL